MSSGRKRNPASENQEIMRLLFGEEAIKYSSNHNKWPEPQNSIYWRLWNSGLFESRKKLRILENKLKSIMSEL